MFRDMRRGKQALTEEERKEILYSGSSGVLALSGNDDYPYALPISYFYDGDKLYFHCAKDGHKIDAIKRNDKASFCVIAQDKISPEEYTTHYQSVIVFGRISIIEDELQKLFAIRKLAEKYVPGDSKERRDSMINKEWDTLCMLQMEIEHITGKEARELKMLRKK